MNKTTKSSRLQGKDLMNIGIYSAIYCVIVTGVAMLGYIPIMMPMLCALVPLIAGVPFMLFLTKVKKFGMIWIMSIIIGIFMILTGMAHYALIVGFFTGLIAELIYKKAEDIISYFEAERLYHENNIEEALEYIQEIDKTQLTEDYQRKVERLERICLKKS